MGSWLGAVVVVVVAATASAQNSTRKIRPRPSDVAVRAGSAVHWRQDLDSARAESEKTRKPVFWYVPTVRGSPMDRKPEIDRYMMAGPFCWPRLIALLNQHYVPVKAIPRGGLARDLRLEPGKFIEPGYVVLGPGGKALRRLDRITTLHPESFIRPLAKLVGRPLPKRELPAPLAAAWQALQRGDYQGVGAALQLHALADLEVSWRAEACYLCGVAELRQGRSDAALELWQMGKDKFPGTNFGWKCAAEVEGHGPLYYGFEVYRELPPKVLEATAPGSRAPAGAYSEEELRRRGIEFLLCMQRSNGGYTDSRYDFGGTDSLPNVHVACTALIGLALVVTADPADKALSGRTDRALENLRSRYLVAPESTNTADADELVWAYAYRARLQAEQMQRSDGSPPGTGWRAKTWSAWSGELQEVVDQLLKLQPDSGQWRHEYPNPFATATVLQVLALAKKAGAHIDTRRVARGIAALKRCRGESGGFTYGSVSRGRPRVDVRGAAGRMPLCELALLLWGESDQEKLGKAIQVSFEHHHRLEAVRKYDDHADRFGYGGFFFWFDMLGRTDAILALTDKGQRDEFLQRQREIILQIPEIDGCFVDSHELGRTYGTAMALLCLARIRNK